MELEKIFISTGLFEEGEWLKKYKELINNNLNTPKIKYKTQVHHILPRCYFKYVNLPTNEDPSNKINLLYKDHLLAHYYLYLSCKNGTSLKGMLAAACFRVINNQHTKSDISLEDMLKNLDYYQQLYEDYRARIVEKTSTPEVRAKQSSSLKSFWSMIHQDSERMHEMSKHKSESLQGHIISPEARDKISISRRMNAQTLALCYKEDLLILFRSTKDAYEFFKVHYPTWITRSNGKLRNFQNFRGRVIYSSTNKNLIDFNWKYVDYFLEEPYNMIVDDIDSYLTISPTKRKERTLRRAQSRVTIILNKGEYAFGSFSDAYDFMLKNHKDNLSNPRCAGGIESYHLFRQKLQISEKNKKEIEAYSFTWEVKEVIK